MMLSAEWIIDAFKLNLLYGILKRFNEQRNLHWTEVYNCITPQGRGLYASHGTMSYRF